MPGGRRLGPGQTRHSPQVRQRARTQSGSLGIPGSRLAEREGIGPGGSDAQACECVCVHGSTAYARTRVGEYTRVRACVRTRPVRARARVWEYGCVDTRVHWLSCVCTRVSVGACGWVCGCMWAYACVCVCVCVCDCESVRGCVCVC